jgi:transcription-repair coupling factor (superfamily II helicase)
VHANINLGLDIRIPQEYIADEHQRLRAYKKIAGAATREQARDILAELEDRYGQAPEAVRTLLEFSLLKTVAERVGVELIERRQGKVNLKFHQESRVDAARLMELVRSTSDAQFTPAGVLRLPAGNASPAELLETLKQALEQLAGAPQT